MKAIFLFLKIFIILSFFIYPAHSVHSLTDNTFQNNSVNAAIKDSIGVDSDDSIKTLELITKLAEIEQLQREDSITKAQLEAQLNSLKTTDNLQKQELQKKLDELHTKEENRIAQKKAQIESLKEIAVGYPVFGPLHDTLFYIYTKIGSFSASERAENVTKRVRKLYRNEFLELDSIKFNETDNSVDIVYKDVIIMSVTESDALWYGEKETTYELAKKNAEIIKTSIQKALDEHTFLRTLIRIGLTILVIIGAVVIIWLINKLRKKALAYLLGKKEKVLKDFTYKGYTLLSVKQEFAVISFFINILRWVLIILAVYLILPIVFSIFPVTREWADTLFGFIWIPFKKLLVSFWNYLPKIFTIIVIAFVFKYIIRFTKYFFNEISTGKLKIPGFFPDWAMPTFHIVRIILYAFAFVMIFPNLPGANSPIFAGVSVFLGLLVSLGSSSAIANIIAGLVITYMRPFKIGDRIQFGDKTGDVIEKTILVTRLKTIKNEEITIPNATILTGNTVNYSSFSQNEGLIIHSEVTMGYDYAWQEIHQALLDAASKTENILKDPKPFILQVSLDDFYVTYQVNAYIRNASGQSRIYSELHQNIQDIFNERGFELLSPHYEANRDGNNVATPKKYVPKDYKTPAFNVKINNEPDVQSDKPKEVMSDK